MILANKALKEISGRYPLDEEQLKDISGIGGVKFENMELVFWQRLINM